MSDDIPEPWRQACESKGISPTYRPLAAAAGISHETARKVVQGRRTSKASLEKVAAALGVRLEVLHEWRREAPPDYGRDFAPDPSASLLTTEEREAVNSIIRLLTNSRTEQRKEVGNDGGSAPTSRPATRPDHDDDDDDGTLGGVTQLRPRGPGGPGQATVDERPMAASPGIPANPPDHTTGEHSDLGPDGFPDEDNQDLGGED